jgi:hypothetical protein
VTRLHPGAPQLDNKEREVVNRLSALLQADEVRVPSRGVLHWGGMHVRCCADIRVLRAQLLPPATKLAAVAASRAQFAAVREKIREAASMQVGGTTADAGGLHSALCAAGADDAEKDDDDDDDEQRTGMAPAGAADSDQEGSAEAGRRTRVRAQPIATLPHTC